MPIATVGSRYVDNRTHCIKKNQKFVLKNIKNLLQNHFQVQRVFIRENHLYRFHP